MHFTQWVDAVIQESNASTTHPNKGMFTVYFDNSKRRGASRPVQHCEAEGTLYSSGHVHLDTRDLPVCDFLSMQQMIDQLGEWGNCAVMWDEDGK